MSVMTKDTQNTKKIKKAVSLLQEHQLSVKNVRVMCEKLLCLLEKQVSCLKDTEDSVSGDDKKNILKSIIQIGQFITKLLPLEHKLYGTFLVKNNELFDIISKGNESTSITENDIAILEKFFEKRKKGGYVKNKKTTKNIDTSS